MADPREARIPLHTIISRLGRGGMATVFLARHDQLGRLVAVKVIDDRFDDDVQFRQRFEREARTAAGLTHPNIVPVHEYGFTEEGRPFISMAFIEGGSLRERLRTRGPLPVDAALAITRQIAGALLVAHARNIVHRDLKPDNVLFQNDTALLTDFGIAKVLDASTTLTGTGANPGTVKYFSPEQAKELAIDQRSDIYALGVVLYEMLTGYLPHAGDTAMQLILGIAHRAPDPLPPALRGMQPFLDVLLAKEPADRLGSCADVIAIVQAMERNWLRHGEVDRLTDGVDLSTTGQRPLDVDADLQPTLLQGGGMRGDARTGDRNTSDRNLSLGSTGGRNTGSGRSAPSVADMLAEAHAGLTLSTAPGTDGVRTTPMSRVAPQGLLDGATMAGTAAGGAAGNPPPAVLVGGRPVSAGLAAGILGGVIALAVLGTWWFTRPDVPAAAPLAADAPASAALGLLGAGGVAGAPDAANGSAVAQGDAIPSASKRAAGTVPEADDKRDAAVAAPLGATVWPDAAATQAGARPQAAERREETRREEARREAARVAAREEARRQEPAPARASAPEPAAANLQAPPRELLAGRWEYSGTEDGEAVRIIWDATEDGRSRYLVNPGKPNVNAYEGRWEYANGVFTETLASGRRIRADIRMVSKHVIDVRVLDGERARDVRRRFRRQ